MNLDLTVVFSSLAGLFLLLGTGYMAVKRNIVAKSATAPFSALLLRIALPCVIFTSILQPYDPDFLVDSAFVVVVTGGLLVLNILIAWFASKLLCVRESSRGVWCILSSFCNNGFMGFPVVLALFGEDGLALAAMICIPFNLLLYSISAYLLGGGAGLKGSAGFSLKKVLLTPINGAVVLGVLAYLTQFSIPDVVLNPIQYMGNITTPLSMFVTGMSLAGVSAKSIFSDRDVLTAAAMRLLLLPALAFAVLCIIPFQNHLIPSVILVVLAMPSASIITTLAETYGGDRELSAKVIFLTSLLCIVSIPLFTMFL